MKDFDDFSQEKTILKEVDELTMWDMLDNTRMDNDYDWDALLMKDETYA